MSKKIRQKRHSKKYINTIYRLKEETGEAVDLFSRSKDKRDLKLIATNWRKENLGHIFQRDINSSRVIPVSRLDIKSGIFTNTLWSWLNREDWSKF